MSSLVRDTGDVQVVNVRNAGTLPFLSDDAVIEVPAVVDARGATPLPAAPVAPLFAGLIAHVTAYEELAVDAAIRGGRERVFKALLAHPLVGQIDLANAPDRPAARREPPVPAMGGRPAVTDGPIAAVLAIDGGNSKTDVALVADDGTVLGRSRGPRALPDVSGMAGALHIIGELVSAGRAPAGSPSSMGRSPRTPPRIWRASTSRPKQLRCTRRWRHRAGAPPPRSTTTRSLSFAPARRGTGASAWFPARGSTPSASRPTAGWPATWRSAKPPAISAAATTCRSRSCTGPFAPKTAAAARPR